MSAFSRPLIPENATTPLVVPSQERSLSPLRAAGPPVFPSPALSRPRIVSVVGNEGAPSDPLSLLEPSAKEFFSLASSSSPPVAQQHYPCRSSLSAAALSLGHPLLSQSPRSPSPSHDNTRHRNSATQDDTFSGGLWPTSPDHPPSVFSPRSSSLWAFNPTTSLIGCDDDAWDAAVARRSPPQIQAKRASVSTKFDEEEEEEEEDSERSSSSMS